MTEPLDPLWKIKVTVAAASGLPKRDVFRQADPFAVITVDGNQTNTTSVIKATSNPCWNETFDITVKASSVVGVRIFDQRRFKREDQGFLGEVNVRVSDVLDFELGGHKVLSSNLKGSNDHITVRGKLTVAFSATAQQSISNPDPSQVAGLTMVLPELGLNGTNSSLLTSTTAKDQPHPPPISGPIPASSATTASNVPSTTSTTQPGATQQNAQMHSTRDSETNADPTPERATIMESTGGIPQLNVPQYKRDFERKLIHFRSQPAMQVQPGNCRITVRRKYIFEDSHAQIMKLTPNDLKKRLIIKFAFEDDSSDSNLKEFFSLVFNQVFSPDYAMFYSSADNSYTHRINPLSMVNPDHLGYFKCIGRLLGLAILHHHFLDAYFDLSLYKMILKKKVTIADLETIDAESHQALTCLLECDITDVVEETFTITEDHFGLMKTTPLKPGGAHILVTEENKREYVDLIVDYRICKRVKDQSEALMSGLNELVSHELLSVFDERELELLISGMPEIDVDDWVKFTDYSFYYVDHEVIQWFWKCVRSWPPERRSRLLQFVTGTSRIPFGGFRNLQGSDGLRSFTIGYCGDTSQLPMSHMCFNRIDLPPYEDYATLEQKLTLAVDESIGLFQE